MYSLPADTVDGECFEEVAVSYPIVNARIRYQERVLLELLAEKIPGSGLATEFKKGIHLLAMVDVDAPLSQDLTHQPYPAKNLTVRPNTVEEGIIDSTLQRWGKKAGYGDLFKTIMVLLMREYPDVAREARVKTLQERRRILLENVADVDHELDSLGAV